MRIIVSGKGLREEMSRTPGSSGFTFHEEPQVARAAWSFLTPSAAEAWIIAAELLSDTDTKALEDSKKQGIAVTPVILFRRLDPTVVRRAWNLARVGVNATFDHGEALAAASALSTSGTGIVSYISTRLRVEDPVVERAIKLLGTVNEACVEPASGVAARLRVSRSSLFRAFSLSDGPRLEDLQIVFRLIRSTALLRAGSSLETASFSVGFSDASSLRKAYVRKIGCTYVEARKMDGCWLVDAWLERLNAVLNASAT